MGGGIMPNIFRISAFLFCLPALSACSVLPEQDPLVKSNLGVVVSELAALHATYDKDSKSVINAGADAEVEKHFDQIFTSLNVAEWRAEARQSEASGISARVSEILNLSVKNCRGGVQAVYKLAHSTEGLSKSSFDESLVRQTCTIVFQEEESLRGNS